MKRRLFSKLLSDIHLPDAGAASLSDQSINRSLFSPFVSSPVVDNSAPVVVSRSGFCMDVSPDALPSVLAGFPSSISYSLGGPRG